jgi:hypothetical protein
VTQVGEGHEAAGTAPPVMTFGAPTIGEILAERYQLEEHINDDSAGRQVWRGIDVVLRRPVAVVLRYPGGDSAAEMLQAAVAASRVVHPNLVGVYDAIDEADRAYVVREWVDGSSLRELVADGLLDPHRATAIVNAVAGAVAAIHATGMVHGNIHPGTVLVGHDGRVVLADARADDEVTNANDVRCLGGVLYYALTGHWPQSEVACTTSLPDAVRDTAGGIAAPRQMRAGVPTYLDDLAMDLLDQRLAPPAADVLAAELSRLDGEGEEHFFDDTGPLRFHGDVEAEVEEAPEHPRPGARKIAVGVAGLLVIAVAGTVFGLRALAGDGDDAGRPTGPDAVAAPTTDPAAVAGPKPITLTADQVRVVDPNGERDELKNVSHVVDGDEETGWKTHHYFNNPKFGGIKPGMGILIDLREPRLVSSIRVQFTAAGATVQMRHGTADPGDSSSGDKKIDQAYENLGQPEVADANWVFGRFDESAKYRYLMIWITQMPKDGDLGYQIGVQEIAVAGP